MSYLSFNGAPVVSGSLSVPRTGVWHATLQVDSDHAALATGAGVLTLGEGASTWSGTVFRGGESFGKLDVAMVGGKGGMSTSLPGQSYVRVPASVPVGDLLSGAGETLSPSAEAGLLATQLTSWTRLEGRASYQISALSSQLGAPWRLVQDGTVWLGHESWPDAPAFDFDLLGKLPQVHLLQIASTESYRLLPGQLFDGHKVDYVEHTFDASSLRTSIWYS